MTENTAAPNRILCPYCKRLITLLSIKYGSTEKCPHCELDFVVSHRLLPQDSAVSVEDEEGEYTLKTIMPAPIPGDDLLSDAGVPEKPAAAKEIEKEPPTWRPMQTPPMEIFLKGTFTYPFCIRSRGCLLVLAMLSFLMIAIADWALYFGSFPQERSSMFAWMVSMIFTYIDVMLGVAWFITFSAYGLGILTDTSEGMEIFESRPSGLFTEWIEEACYVMVNLFFGAFPALILLWILPDRPAIKMAIVVLSETILFPVFLLSALANSSVVRPYSRSVWRSLWLAWHAWVLFYLFTLLIGESLVFFWRWFPFKGFWTDIIIASLIMSFFLIVYFRLLGRLAWFCSGRYNEMHPPKEKS